ncbi:hypothetical protein [Peribacillus sp. FSL R5-0717]|uniref:hypothetical protein n=1 Tax=Peribacillus sp. FSL R5-0717 TaxID=2975308 RepID=UPI0030FB407D
MSRAVTGDHVLFNECITMFRPENIEIKEDGEQLNGYLLLDFRLNETLNFRYFSIEPSIEVTLPGAYSAFVAPVKLPKWCNWSHNAHLFTIALAAIFSFVSGRPVKAPRDGLTNREQLTGDSLGELAVQFPVITAGPGAHDTRISKKSSDDLYKRLQEITEVLFSVSYKQYITAMQSIRLVHLAHLNKRDDFGLAYYLLVSSMESLAGKAIKSKTIANKHPNEDVWKKVAENDADFADLFHEYIAEKGKNKLIGKRFEKFILKYCPPNQWNDLQHPQENSVSYIEELTGNRQHEWITKKQWYEIYPEDLTDDEISKLLKDLYVHRSNFTHRGENPPHQHPNSHNRFFDGDTVIRNENGDLKILEIILPNFQLISFISNRSITNYLKEKVIK